MTNLSAHVEEVYMCFLPFQFNQWRPTTISWIDDRVEQFYHSEEEELDTYVNQYRLIGIKAGNPKRYTTEDELLLHNALLDIHVTEPLTIDLMTLAAYIDVSALYWTIKERWPHADVLGYEETLPTHSFTNHTLQAHDLYQILPLTYHDYSVHLSEWRTEQPVKQMVIVMDAILLKSTLFAAEANTLVVSVDTIDTDTQEIRIARNGQLVTYTSVRQALMYDLLHYALQFKVEPVILSYRHADTKMVTQYGKKRSADTALKYRMQNPHYQLFPSSHRQLNDLSLNHFADSYGIHFTITEFSAILPLKYHVELIHEMLTIDN